MNQSEFAAYVSKRGGVPLTTTKKWVGLIFTCLRECIIKENIVMIPGVGEFRHAVRKGGPTRNPFTNERYECPPRDVLKFKVAKKLRTDYYVAVRDGIVPSNTPNGFQQSRKLTAEEIKELGYKKPAPPHRAYMRCKAKAQGIEYNPNDYGANYDVVYDTEEYERRKKEGTLYGDKTSTGDAVTDNGTQTN